MVKYPEPEQLAEQKNLGAKLAASLAVENARAAKLKLEVRALRLTP